MVIVVGVQVAAPPAVSVPEVFVAHVAGVETVVLCPVDILSLMDVEREVVTTVAN